MVRILIGSVLGGIVQWIIGALFWATPLGRLAFRSLGDGETADLQASMARTLTQTGTGTYFIPSPETAQGGVLLGRGPVGLVFFNTDGFAAMDWSALATGLVMSIVMLLLVGVALSLVDGLQARLRVLMLFAAAAVLYFILAMPVYNYYLPWTWWVYLAISDFVAFAAGGFILTRWFVPSAPVARTDTLH